MTGSVEALSLQEAKRSSASDQSRLASFGENGSSDTTYVGIVRSPSDEFEEAVDEVEPDLAPPEDLFYQWLNSRKDYEENGLSRRQAHEKALQYVDYRPRFREYLDTEEARDALSSLADRVADGEHTVLVCYCSDGRWCHREPVADTVESVVDEMVEA